MTPSRLDGLIITRLQRLPEPCAMVGPLSADLVPLADQRLTIDVADQKAAQELFDEIRRANPRLQVELDSPSKDELYPVISILLAAAASVPLVKILNKYLQRRSGVTLKIRSEKRTIVVQSHELGTEELQKLIASLITDTGSGESIDPVDPWPRR